MYENEPHSPALLVLPGLLCDSRMFSALIAAFPGTQVVDGFYAGATRIEAMAEHVIARISQPVSLLGHSMGARVALEVVRRAPQMVERLALVDTGIHTVRPGEADKRHALRDLGRAEGMSALVDRWLPPMLAPQARKDEALVNTLRAMCIDAGIAVYEAQAEALLNRPAVDDLLGTIRCPTIAIVGELDEWSPPAQHEQIAAAIPAARLSIVPQAGHMMPAEKPDAFNAAVKDWLATPTQSN